ncbi:hypothetical protein FB451DRAFT_1186604 [Mycena latifolia]|nr:hypothetical protein FB451DRAFT_1186604 [Mycena latifolia]
MLRPAAAGPLLLSSALPQTGSESRWSVCNSDGDGGQVLAVDGGRGYVSHTQQPSCSRAKIDTVFKPEELTETRIAGSGHKRRFLVSTSPVSLVLLPRDKSRSPKTHLWSLASGVGVFRVKIGHDQESYESVKRSTEFRSIEAWTDWHRNSSMDKLAQELIDQIIDDYDGYVAADTTSFHSWFWF